MVQGYYMYYYYNFLYNVLYSFCVGSVLTAAKNGKNWKRALNTDKQYRNNAQYICIALLALLLLC